MAGKKRTIQELKLLYYFVMRFLKYCPIDIILFYGTLLGLYRDKNFINDDDIDVIVSRKNYILLKEYIDKNIHNYSYISLGINNESIIQLYYNEIGPFDIYIYDNYTDNKNIDYILLRWDGNLLFEKQYIFPLKTISFNNFNISIPKHTKTILKQIYGKDWKIPQIKNKDYIWTEINTVKCLI